MAPYIKELTDLYIDRERAECIAPFFFIEFRNSLKSSFQNIYQEGFNSEEEIFRFLRKPLSLEYVVPKKGREISTINMKQVFVGIYKSQGIVILKELVETNREAFSFFGDHELGAVVTKKSRIFGDKDEISEEHIFNAMVEYDDYRCILDDTGEEGKYYMLLQTAWNPENPRNKVLNDFFNVEKNGINLVSE